MMDKTNPNSLNPCSPTDQAQRKIGDTIQHRTLDFHKQSYCLHSLADHMDN